MADQIPAIIHGFKATLVGLAQIMLQSSVAVGAAFLIGTFLNSPALAILGLIGSAAGALTAMIAGFDQQDTRNGLFGFNGALVGFGLGYFYGPQWALVVFVLLGAAASAMIMKFMQDRGLRPLTFPFVIASWLIMMLFAATGWFKMVPWSLVEPDHLQIAHAFSRGFGQVLFQENILTGFLLIAAVTLNSWIEGLFAIFASVIGILLALSIGLPIDAINLGLFGYNGVLCAIAFSGQTLHDFVSAFVAILLSIFIFCCVDFAGIPALTSPFVAATWAVFWARKKFLTKFSEHSAYRR